MQIACRSGLLKLPAVMGNAHQEQALHGSPCFAPSLAKGLCTSSERVVVSYSFLPPRWTIGVVQYVELHETRVSTVVWQAADA